MKYYFVEKLTLLNWVLCILPHLLRGRGSQVYVFDCSSIVLWLAQALARLLDCKIEKFAFRLVDVKDEEDLLILLRIEYQDLAQVELKITKEHFNPLFQKEDKPKNRLSTYLFKDLSAHSIYGRHTLSHALLLVQLVIWKMRTIKNISKEDPVLFLNQRPWLAFIRSYAVKHGVKITLLLPKWRLNLKRPWMVPFYRAIQSQIWKLRHGSFQKKKQPERGPKLMVECHYHVNLNRPEVFSELFFLQQSNLAAQDFIVTFHVPKDPLDAKKLSELKAYGIAALPLRAKATIVSDCPPYTPRFRLRRTKGVNVLKNHFSNRLEAKWFETRLLNYQSLKAYWSEIFSRFHIKFYVSWYKYGPEHCAIADAMEMCGGISALYQRALEMNPSRGSSIDVALYFGFSKYTAELERCSQSKIPYFVVTGYLGDHRFSLLKDMAIIVRDRLRAHGAERIVSFTDENSHDGERWSLGHTITRDNYGFLLEKVLTHPWFGLVLKPKVPATLRYRLGPVASLLEEALATGRCCIYEEGGCHGSFPPAAAALAADIAIHGHLCAPTAGFETALAGKPTLLIDKEGWSKSPLYQLGRGKVVFNDWKALWEECHHYWKDPSSYSDFGDWSSLLETLDPFRDGRAAERMGTYIQWLMEGFKEGLSRETVMADAADRYCKKWGSDKVLAIH